MVPEAGLEPARYFYRGILSPLCLPIPPPGLKNNYTSKKSSLTISNFQNDLFLKKGFNKLKMEAEVGIEPA